MQFTQWLYTMPGKICSEKGIGNQDPTHPPLSHPAFTMETSCYFHPQALEVFSVKSAKKKTLYPECAGHFSISPSLTSLPLVTFLEHVKDPFPFKAQLFFKDEDLKTNYRVDAMIPPISLTQEEVSVLKRVTETSVIASPFFEDSPVDVSNSENLINIPLDRQIGKIEISVVEVRGGEREEKGARERGEEGKGRGKGRREGGRREEIEGCREGGEVGEGGGGGEGRTCLQYLAPHFGFHFLQMRDTLERNTLFNNSMTVYQKVDFSKLKYYHDAESEIVYYTQTHLYTKCQNKDKIGIKLVQPAWNSKATAESVSHSNS